MVKYGKLLLDTDRSLSLLLSPSSSFSLPRSPNQGKGRQEGMEVTEPEGETSVGSSTRSSLDALVRNNYDLVKKNSRTFPFYLKFVIVSRNVRSSSVQS